MIWETIIMAFCFALPWLILGFIFTISDMKADFFELKNTKLEDALRRVDDSDDDNFGDV